MKSLSGKEFELIHNTGRPYYTKHLKAKILKAKETKWGFVVSGKHGNAVKRNRIKRMLRAAAADIEKKLSTGACIIIMPKVEDFLYLEIKEQIYEAAKKAGLIS